jgi:DNA-binding transcriptional LysR family regulator
MSLDTLQSMHMFIRAVELGSFSSVAREEHTSQPTVSKVIAALERDLEVRLLERTTTSLSLTAEGRLFYERSKRLLEEYNDAVADVRGQTQQFVGTLRVAAPVGLGELRLNTLIIEFLAKYPEIEIELILNDRVMDLTEEGFDIAIRLGGCLPPNVIARHIGSSPRILVATPAYIKRNSSVRRPEDLVKHEYMQYAGLIAGSDLELVRGVEKIGVTVKGRYRVNNSLALRQCLLEGIGLGSAPAWLVQDLIDTGALIHLLPKWKLPSQPVHLVYPPNRLQPLRTRALLQFISERILEVPGIVTPEV